MGSGAPQRWSSFRAGGAQQDAHEFVLKLLDLLSTSATRKAYFAEYAEYRTCPCGWVSTSVIAEPVLQLSLPQSARAEHEFDVQALLDAHLAEEELSEFACGRQPALVAACAARKARKRSAWVSAPRTLVLHAARFRAGRKLHSRLANGVTLVLVTSDGARTYDLEAVVEHRGPYGSGRYMCHARCAPGAGW